MLAGVIHVPPLGGFGTAIQWVGFLIRGVIPNCIYIVPASQIKSCDIPTFSPSVKRTSVFFGGRLSLMGIHLSIIFIIQRDPMRKRHRHWLRNRSTKAGVLEGFIIFINPCDHIFNTKVIISPFAWKNHRNLVIETEPSVHYLSFLYNFQLSGNSGRLAGASGNGIQWVTLTRSFSLVVE